MTPPPVLLGCSKNTVKMLMGGRSADNRTPPCGGPGISETTRRALNDFDGGAPPCQSYRKAITWGRDHNPFKCPTMTNPGDLSPLPGGRGLRSTTKGRPLMVVPVGTLD